MLTFPRVSVSGGPYERGSQFGRATARAVQRSVSEYQAVVAHMRGWDWSRAKRESKRFEQAIADLSPAYVEELRGIADGATIDFEDVLALNCRTELMFGTGLASTTSPESLAECTAMVVCGERADGRTLLAQNWDWLVGAKDQVVVLESVPDDGPAFLTVVEAGLLAKVGFNSAGLGIVTNALVSDSDLGTPGVPMHATLRALFDCTTVAEAESTLKAIERSSSGSYIVATGDGHAAAIEVLPGGADRVFVNPPVAGLATHTNHFLDRRFDGEDVMTLGLSPSSGLRLERIRDLTKAESHITPDVILRALADHEHGQSAICLHPDVTLPRAERPATICALVMDLADRLMWLTSGPPCDSVAEELTLSRP